MQGFWPRSLWTSKFKGLLLIFVGLLLTGGVHAEGKLFAIVSKNLNDINFINAWQGCQEEAEKNGDTCKHVGEPEFPHFRIQDSVISQVLEEPVDGIAVSVLNSEYLASHSLKLAYEKKLPVVTFDSDLEPQHQYLRKAYIGPDNKAFGHNLAREAKRYRPEGGNVCLMSGAVFDPNLNNRIQGIREELSGDSAWDRKRKLDGQNGWSEPDRCPWYNWDNYERALQQMWEAIYRSEINVFISVGAWPVSNPTLYQDVMSPARQLFLEAKGKIVVVGIGTPEAAHEALLEKQYVHAYVAIDFREMGRLTYENLKKLSEGEEIPEWTWTNNRVHRWDD
ncbi:substrate-binding domain-containing protein [Hahella ganghwensis]|uniref:substrate-binding domain-containing protein n=1 Tax=Hahella ganghwensis TaxID=286420 RepID=UPI00037BDBE2|nr:substrate-binding domain-containing protein [Hahella ganghwensis]